ncbi:6-aminohexanoate-dimer hydrolase [Planctomycetes bacterium CA13]|uniref:6-aminohexanoate-dimer hydrolase n=1 Tax=Novipirellula herctigrandis TaxID=2527986 RepID=A0A5C5ZBN3_9BACT|nr:6-aminohexanoate-dimer hydrolase [Planctomycetes bacterium CA13]
MKKNEIRSLFAVLILSSFSVPAIAQETKEGINTEAIIGSTARTAGQGYTQAETLEHLGNFDHPRWDVKDDETKRFAHLNGPQIFTHAWVHRDGPISLLQTDEQPRIGKVKASTPIGDITLDQWIADGTVDGFLVLHHGKIVFEQYPRMRSFDKHHWWSTRKGLVGTVIAMLEDEGKVDVSLGVENYVPELKGTAWDGVPVIDVLDMASGTSGVEVDDPDALTGEKSRYYQYEASVGNRPATAKTAKSTYDYVAGLSRHRPNGEAYEYTTVNTFVLTWLAESVTGKPFAEVVSEKIWRPMGAQSDGVMMVSSAGASSTINSTLRDLGRFGLLFTPSWQTVSQRQLVSDAYLKKIQQGGRPEIFDKAGAGKNWTGVFPDDQPMHNTYQWDFVMPDGDFFKAGHCGQGLYLSPQRDVVVAFFGSGDDPSIVVSLKLARAIAKSFK